MKRRILSMLSVLLMLCVLTMSVSAAEVPDLDRLGSISIHMSYDGENVGGGSLTVLQVASVHLENQADYSFRYTGEFENCQIPLDNLGSAQTAQSLADYAQAAGISGTKLEINRNGSVVFMDLPLGLYLLVQENAAPGYEAVDPFLVSVPGKENGSLVYHVDGSPKLQLEQAPTEPSEPSEPTEPTEPDLPQTGMNNWPIPVLVMLGLCLIVLGCVFVAAGKKKHHEN